MSESPRIKILVYDFGWGRSIIPALDRGPGCEITLAPGRWNHADVVVFHVPTAPPLGRLRKRPGQKWVAWSMESEVNYPRLRDPDYMRQFDITMTYRLDSDVPAPYFGPGTRDHLQHAPGPKTADAPAVYFASNSNDKSGRLNYVRELMQHLPVDSYGQSLQNRKLAEDNGRDTKLETMATYKFTLAFENSITRDYVTEKFFDPMIAGSVPVYLGAPNIEEFAPGERCFVDVTRFKGPGELAEYLRFAAENDAEYESYLVWKTRPMRQSFLDKVEFVADDPFRRLCEKVRQMKASERVGFTPRLGSAVSAVARTVRRRLGLRE